LKEKMERGEGREKCKIANQKEYQRGWCVYRVSKIKERSFKMNKKE